MRVLLYIFLCFNFTLLAQDNCNLDVDATAKKHYNKAKRLADGLRYSESIYNIKKALEIQSNYPNAYFLMGRIWPSPCSQWHSQVPLFRQLLETFHRVHCVDNNHIESSVCL